MSDPPCHAELFYREGELINVDDGKRVQGASSSFHPTLVTDIPLSPSREELTHFVQHERTSPAMRNVVDELYRNDRSDPSDTITSDKNEAFQRVFDNTHQRQYYLKVVKEPATVTHIISNGRFWGTRWKGLPIGLTTACTNGFLWCNTNPNWTWKIDARSDTVIRCRIDLPRNTQVVVDRSPVGGGTECAFDEHRTSLFPDVLLPPAEFKITHMKRYRSDSDNPIHEDGVELLTPLKTRPDSVVLSDKEYAQFLLSDVSNFIDLRLTVTCMMQLPDSPDAPKPHAPTTKP